jgi:hypothetical protein
MAMANTAVAKNLLVFINECLPGCDRCCRNPIAVIPGPALARRPGMTSRWM